MEEDSCIPIILTRPFFTTARAMIDVKNERLFLQVRDKKVQFHLPQSMASPTLDFTYYRVDVMEEILSSEAMTCHSIKDLLEAVMINCDVFASQTRETEKCARLLDASTAYTRKQCPKEVLNVEVQAS